MKISNWCNKLTATLVASGVLAPAVSYAVNIPLGDAGFEDYVVPAAVGYAYSNEYRPTSAWVDDLDSPPGYTEDDGDSNWLYDAAYAESETFTKRASPRSGTTSSRRCRRRSGARTTPWSPARSPRAADARTSDLSGRTSRSPRRGRAGASRVP